MSIFLGLLLMVGVVSAQQNFSSQCLPNYPNYDDVIVALDKVTIPTSEFNASCLLANCPNLGQIPCPFYNNTKTDNATAINAMLVQTGICFQSQQTLCGAPFRSVPLCPVGMTLAAITGNPNINGTANVMPNSGTMTGLDGVNVAYEANTGNGIIMATLFYKFQIQGSASLGGIVLPFSNVPGLVTINARIIIHVNSSLPNPVAVLNHTITATSQIGFLYPDQNQTDVGDQAQNGLDTLVSRYVQGSPLGDDLGNFYGTIFAKLCLLSQRKCPWITNPGNK